MRRDAHEQRSEEHAADAGREERLHLRGPDDPGRLAEPRQHEPELAELREPDAREPGDARREAHRRRGERGQQALAEQEEQVPLQKIRVLIAEDNYMNQQLVRHLMKSWSMDHLIVNTGLEAVEELRNNSYSIVLMDIQMPDMDGYTATSIIRKELDNDVPIIAMTAHAMVGEKEKCLQLGMNDYVSKPIKETVLYNIIARHAQHIPEKNDHPAHIKLDYLHQLSGHDANFEKEILNQFIIQVPTELSQLEESINESDFDMVRRVAHSLKSTVGYVGLADDLHPYLEEIEKDAAVQNVAHFEKNFNYVNSKCQKAIGEVKSLLGNGFV